MTEDKPEWERNLENWKEKFKQDHSEKRRKPWEHKGNFVGAIIGNLIALVLINMLPVRFPHFFTAAYPALLSVANMVILIQIGINILMFFIPLRWFYYLGQSASNAFGLISIIVGVVLFPFNVPFGLEFIVRFGLTIGGIVTAIVGVVYLIKAFFAVLTPLK